MSSGGGSSYNDTDTGGGWTQRTYNNGSSEWIHDNNRNESGGGWSNYTNSNGESKWEHDSGQTIDDNGNVSWDNG